MAAPMIRIMKRKTNSPVRRNEEQSKKIMNVAWKLRMMESEHHSISGWNQTEFASYYIILS